MKPLPRSSGRGMKMIGKMKKTTITTIMEWVANPSVGNNNSAKTLITVSHLNARSFLAIITHTLATFIIFAAIYMLH